jgi:hypothetical protein
MKTEFEKRLAVVKREASRAIKYHGGEVNEIKRKALDNVKNQFDLNLWYEYRNSITTLSYNGDISMRAGAIEAFKVQFGL